MNQHRKFLVFGSILIASMVVILSGCYSQRRGQGGGQTEFAPPRKLDAADVSLPTGYRIEVVTTEFLTFPTGIAFDDDGRAYVVESGYAYGEVWAAPRLLRIEDDGHLTEVATGGHNGPWTGVFFHDGNFYVAEGGEMDGGKILKISKAGKITPILENLPSRGDHHTNGPVVGRDHKVYFGQGVATNSGVVGLDNANFGWLARYPEFHDIPCEDLTLVGDNFESADPLKRDGKATTGAYLPFGTLSTPGQVIKGQVPCSGSIMRCETDGSDLQVIAWGLRNPFGMSFGPDDKLYVLENGFDERGSRPIFGAGDYLWRIEKRGEWFGWPDYAGGIPIDKGHNDPPGKRKPKRLLAKDPGKPPHPLAQLGVHSSADGIDFSRSATFGHVGEAFVAEFGDETPNTGKVLEPVGYKVVRVDVENGKVEDFAVNAGKTNGPASLFKRGGLERPVSLRFNPSGEALYVVDFGVMLQSPKGAMPQKNTGVIWRITKS